MARLTRLLDRYFRLSENQTDIATEMRAGGVTFFTASYIIFVQPAVLSQAGMDFGAVMTATCISSAIGCLIMGLWANYPIALAPGMGLNFYFTFTVVMGLGISWQTALGAIFLSGVVLILLTVTKVREALIHIIPGPLKCGIAVGIGLFITFIGFSQGGLVTAHPQTLVQLGDLKSLPALFSIFGLILIGTLLQKKVNGAILIGLLTLSILAIPFDMVEFRGLVSTPPSLEPVWMKLDIPGALDLGLLTVAAVFVFVDLFDTAGTLVGVGQQGGFLKDGKLPRASRALLPDAVATTTGSLMGTSTVTCYIESAAGVAEGGRTGLTSVTTALFFLLALFFSPLAQMIGGGVNVDEKTTLYPITAPVLIIVGCLMARNLNRIDWRQWDDSLPAFLVLVGMPLTHSIADGMALGFIAYPIMKVLCGKAKDVHWGMVLIALLFTARYWGL
ncbi:MAG: NCS2 family permease [Nitrospinaceae bacterium]|nr:MAG: NCS2 family permease [Nitrospinaceae bacterium]